MPRIHFVASFASPILGCVLGPLAAPVVAQVTSPDSLTWNSPPTMALVERARVARETLRSSGDLESFQADVEGHIYFFVDPETPLLPSRHLIRVDQVAVEVTWEAPGDLQQHVVGERREERLPVRDFEYYLDRLTLVPYGFGDEIRVGSGQDVSRVPHPFARPRPDADEVYDYRLGDSVTLTLPGADTPVRVRQVIIRPRMPEAPGFVGTIDVDVDTGGIVRMGFTFTPAAYVDPRNDRVAVEVQYDLWEGRFWLPSLQRIEVRREVPGLDLGIGTVIRSVLRVNGYRFNVPVSDAVRARPPFTALPPDQRRAYPFRTGLYADLERDGLTDVTVDSDVEALRDRAMSIMREGAGSGLTSSRLFAQGVSSILRYDRAEGVRVGLGASLSPSPSTRVRASIGYAAAARDIQADITLETSSATDWFAGVRATHDRMLDLGLSPGAAGVISSLGAVLGVEDYRDPFLTSGLEVTLVHRVAASPELRFGLGVTRMRSQTLERTSAPLDDGHSFRPVRPVAEGEFFTGTAGIRAGLDGPVGSRGTIDVETSVLRGQGGSGIGAALRLDERWRSSEPGRHLDLSVRGWLWAGDDLPQGHRLIGGRGTVPGYPFREHAGSRVATASLVGAIPLSSLLSVRAGLHGGWADGLDPRTADLWRVTETGGIATSVSLGVGLGWDILRVDIARGLSGSGEWQALFSIDPTWWPWL